jgi:hypothetical protein
VIHYGGLVEQAPTLEDAEHAALDGALKAVDMVADEMGDLVEANAALVDHFRIMGFQLLPANS